MSRPSRTLIVLCGTAVPILNWAAAISVDHRAWLQAIAFYGLAVLSATAAFREIEHLGHHTNSMQSEPPRPGTATEDAVAIARADFSGACTCERWWTSLGSEHDPGCPPLT